jgi:Ni/Co efflux regulator RcnB
MKKNILIAAVLAATLAGIGSVSAQDRNDNDKRGGPGNSQRDEKRNDKHDDKRDAGPDRRNDRNNYAQNDNHGGDRGAGPRHDMRKGGRLPAEYNNRQYVVDDWRGHHLSAPPRGYHWVQAGSDYVLVAITTGIIASLLLNN